MGIRRPSWGVMIGLLLVLVGAGIGGRVLFRKTSFPSLTVEVLNGTRQPRLAWRTTLWLRQRGVDVWFFGNAPEDTVRQTFLIGLSDSAVAKARALSEALPCHPRVETVKDPVRVVDVVIVLGEDAMRCFPGLEAIPLAY